MSAGEPKLQKHKFSCYDMIGVYRQVKEGDEPFTAEELKKWQVYTIKGENGKECRTGLCSDAEKEEANEAFVAKNGAGSDQILMLSKSEWIKTVQEHLRNPDIIDSDGILTLLMAVDKKSSKIFLLRPAGDISPTSEPAPSP